MYASNWNFTPQKNRFTVSKDLEKGLAAFKAGTMAVREIGFLLAGPDVRLPISTVNAPNRPDLLDLHRVIRTEGNLLEGFDTQTAWNFCLSPGFCNFARLDVRIISPVKASFKVLFDLDSNKYFNFLSDKSTHEMFGINFFPQPLQRALAVQHDRQSLLNGLKLSAGMKGFSAAGGGGRK